MNQATVDMQRRIRNVFSRLVHPASVQEPDKTALTTYFSKSSKRSQLQQLLNPSGSRESPGDFATHSLGCCALAADCMCPQLSKRQPSRDNRQGIMYSKACQHALLAGHL